MSDLSRKADLQVILADTQLKIAEFFPDVSPRRKDLIKAMVEQAWAAGRVSGLTEASDRD